MIFQKSLKYLIQFLVIFISLQYVPSIELPLNDVIIISIIGTISFALLDMYIPVVNVEQKK